MGLLLGWLANAAAVYATAYLVPGIHVNGFVSALIVALVLGLINITVKPILKLLSTPFILLTLGLFLLVINAVALLLADYFVDGLTIDGFLPAAIGSVVISIVSWIVGKILNAVF
ncbi:MAG TPA: phage holin family protein [Patescibacteria group bacterium]|nr:phage holin family protein [Patescibacteria group bacterium]